MGSQVSTFQNCESRTRNEINREINAGVFTPGAGLSTFGTVDSRRPNEAYQGIDETSTTGNSNYNSLQLSANRRFAKGITVLMNYTWSKALDYQSLDRNADLPQDSSNLRNDYGPADFDHRHNFVTSFLADIPATWNQGGWTFFTTRCSPEAGLSKTSWRAFGT